METELGGVSEQIHSVVMIQFFGYQSLPDPALDVIVIASLSFPEGLIG